MGSAYDTGVENAWCTGCGNFGILNAVKRMLGRLGREKHEIVLVSGIGQAAKLPHYVDVNVFDGLHGRALQPDHSPERVGAAPSPSPASKTCDAGRHQQQRRRLRHGGHLHVVNQGAVCASRL